MLPDHKSIPVVDFLRASLAAGPHADAFVIFDSCHLAGGRLPYKFSAETNRFALDRPLEVLIPWDRRILLLTCAAEKNEALMENYGSHFTRELFASLARMREAGASRLIAALLSGAVSDVAAYASLPEKACLWFWLFSTKT